MNNSHAVKIADRRRHERHIDFVERQPILNLVLETFKASRHVFNKQVDSLAIVIAAIFFDQLERHFVMIQRDERLDIILAALVDNVFIKFQARFIRLGVVTVRENSRPTYGETETFKAHLGEKRDVFFVAVIEINRGVRRIKNAVLDCRAESARSVHVAAEK